MFLENAPQSSCGLRKEIQTSLVSSLTTDPVTLVQRLTAQDKWVTAASEAARPIALTLLIKLHSTSYQVGEKKVNLKYEFCIVDIIRY